MMADDEFTGPKRDPRFPDRPQHADFWDLVKIVNALDTERRPVDEAIGIDGDSSMYMARQRALRAETMPELAGLTWRERLQIAWLDGFAAGFRMGQDRWQG